MVGPYKVLKNIFHKKDNLFISILEIYLQSKNHIRIVLKKQFYRVLIVRYLKEK